MGGREYLGEFELVVLLALLRLGDSAYGATIHREILRTTGRDVSIPAVYVTLKRMERKELVSSHVSMTSDSGRRATRHYSVLPKGHASIARSKAQLEQLWTGIPIEGASGGAS